MALLGPGPCGMRGIAPGDLAGMRIVADFALCEDPLFRTLWHGKEAGMEASVPGISAGLGRTDASRSTLSGLRVALVHDWLTGMRGGEKCLEVLCRAFPDATLYTLIHRRGAPSPAIEAMTIRTSPLQRVPGVFRHYRQLLPLMPLAARAWKPGQVDLVISLSHCVAKAVRVPRGVPHVCYCFTPMRYAWQGRDAYLDGWADRPVRRALAGPAARPAPRHGTARPPARVTHFVAISETVRERIARCYGRESRVIPPPVDTELLHARPAVPRDDFYLVRLGAGALQADRPGRDGLLAARAGRWSSSARAPSGRG